MYTKSKRELQEMIWAASDNDSIANLEMSHAIDKAIKMGLVISKRVKKANYILFLQWNCLYYWRFVGELWDIYVAL